MSTNIPIPLIASLGTLLFAGNPQSKEQGDMTLKSVQSGKETNTLVSGDDGVTVRQSNEKGAQMDDHECIAAIGQSQAEPPRRARANAKVTVQSSETEPYD